MLGRPFTAPPTLPPGWGNIYYPAGNPSQPSSCDCDTPEPGSCRPGQGPTNPGMNGTCDLNNRPRPGTCVCLAAGHRVAMADGSVKDSSEIAIGDVLHGISCNREVLPQTVTSAHAFEAETITLFAGSKRLCCTPSHLVLTPELDAVPTSSLQVGDFLYGESGESIQITNIEPSGIRLVFHWTCEPDHTFLVDGIWHHNKTAIAIGVDDL